MFKFEMLSASFPIWGNQDFFQLGGYVCTHVLKRYVLGSAVYNKCVEYSVAPLTAVDKKSDNYFRAVIFPLFFLIVFLRISSVSVTVYYISWRLVSYKTCTPWAPIYLNCRGARTASFSIKARDNDKPNIFRSQRADHPSEQLKWAHSWWSQVHNCLVLCTSLTNIASTWQLLVQISSVCTENKMYYATELSSVQSSH